MIHELPKELIGTGEVKGFIFSKELTKESAYLFVVKTENGIHYEVFLRKSSPVCIDFEKKIYSDKEFKETYPKSNSFGIWAWCYSKKEQALNKFNSL